MDKEEFLLRHKEYVERQLRDLESSKKSDPNFEKSTLARDYQRIKKLEQIISALKSGGILKEEDREIFYWFAVTLPTMGSHDCNLLYSSNPQLYVPCFVFGTLEPILVQVEFTSSREFRRAFYIESQGGHNIKSLLLHQQNKDGSGTSARTLVDHFEAYASIGRFGQG